MYICILRKREKKKRRKDEEGKRKKKLERERERQRGEKEKRDLCEREDIKKKVNSTHERSIKKEERDRESCVLKSE